MLQLSFSSKKNNLECSIQVDIGKLDSENSLLQYQLKTIELVMDFTNVSTNH